LSAKNPFFAIIGRHPIAIRSRAGGNHGVLSEANLKAVAIFALGSATDEKSVQVRRRRRALSFLLIEKKQT